MRRAALALAILAACGDKTTPTPTLPAACTQPTNGTAITFRLIAQTQSAALLLTSPPGDIRRFVVEQEGRVDILTDAGIQTPPFLDVSNDIACCGEQGLLGLAFHPDFATNRKFYVFYTTSDSDILLQYQVSATDPSVADPASKTVLLTIPDFASNHNGGMLEFGKDGKLYIGTGDGGGGGDPHKNGQNPDAQLGKILRLDVDAAGATPEVFALGMRNPWRWSFDRETGDLWIGDVGQDMIEELDMIPAGTKAGINMGWSMYEASSCYAPPCDPAGKTMPQFEATHGDGWCSIIGGEVYRGSCYPDVVGQYYFTDYCKRELYTATKSGTSLTVSPLTSKYIDENGASHDGVPVGPASLHGDARGELFLTTTNVGNTSRGGIWKLEAGP